MDLLIDVSYRILLAILPERALDCAPQTVCPDAGVVHVPCAKKNIFPAGDTITIQMAQQPGDTKCSDEAIGGDHYGPINVCKPFLFIRMSPIFVIIGLPRRRLRRHHGSWFERQLVQDRRDGHGVEQPRLLGHRSAQRKFCRQYFDRGLYNQTVHLCFNVGQLRPLHVHHPHEHRARKLPPPCRGHRCV